MGVEMNCKFCGHDMNYNGWHWCPNGGNQVCKAAEPEKPGALVGWMKERMNLENTRAVQPDEIDEDPPVKVGSLDWYMGEHTRLRARVAELETQNAAMLRDLNGVVAGAVRGGIGAQAERERAAEDLRRKREECERLELQLAQAHKAIDLLQSTRANLGAMHDENARLRRELGRRK